LSQNVFIEYIVRNDGDKLFKRSETLFIESNSRFDVQKRQPLNRQLSTLEIVWLDSLHMYLLLIRLGQPVMVHAITSSTFMSHTLSHTKSSNYNILLIRVVSDFNALWHNYSRKNQRKHKYMSRYMYSNCLPQFSPDSPLHYTTLTSFPDRLIDYALIELISNPSMQIIEIFDDS